MWPSSGFLCQKRATSLLHPQQKQFFKIQSTRQNSQSMGVSLCSVYLPCRPYIEVSPQHELYIHIHTHRHTYNFDSFKALDSTPNRLRKICWACSQQWHLPLVRSKPTICPPSMPECQFVWRFLLFSCIFVLSPPLRSGASDHAQQHSSRNDHIGGASEPFGVGFGLETRRAQVPVEML